MVLVTRLIIISNETGVLSEKHDRSDCIPRGNDDHCSILTCRTTGALEWRENQVTISYWRNEIKALLGTPE